MSTTRLSLVIALLACLVGSYSFAEGEAEMRSLDEQVQEIKSDVLSIAAELDQLEERLLFPSNTQVTIFLALGEAGHQEYDASACPGGVCYPTRWSHSGLPRSGIV